MELNTVYNVDCCSSFSFNWMCDTSKTSHRLMWLSDCWVKINWKLDIYSRISLQGHWWEDNFCWGDIYYSTSIAKCPSLHLRYFLVWHLRARVFHRHIHYRHRFSVWASIVIWCLLTLDDHCVKIWLKEVVLICCIISANTHTYSQPTTRSWQIQNFIFWLFFVTCAYMLFAWFWQFTLSAHSNCYDTSCS